MKDTSDTARQQVIEFIQYSREHSGILKLDREQKDRIAKLIKDYKITEQELENR